MLKYFAKMAILRFERRWNYDGTYMHELLAEAGLGALRPLDALATVSKYRRDVPASVYYAAKVTASLAADCGQCVQLTLSMAEAEGVAPAVLRALVAGEPEALGPPERLGYELARTTLAREAADDVRRTVLARYGRRGLASLAYGIVAAQAFPAFTYATGYGHACTRLRVNRDRLSRDASIVT